MLLSECQRSGKPLSLVSGDIAPGTLNSADEASRGTQGQQFLKNERWFQGLAFLMKPEKEWLCLEVDALPESDPEVKSERAIFTLTLPEKMCELLLKYSAWIVLQQKVTWLLKFKKFTSGFDLTLDLVQYTVLQHDTLTWLAYTSKRYPHTSLAVSLRVSL